MFELFEMLKSIGLFVPLLMCGGKTVIEAPAAPAPAAPVPTAGETAEDIYKAKLKYDPLMNEAAYNIQAGPQGMQQWTQLAENVRQAVFPQEQGVREALGTNILQQLLSPTGISPEQQAAQEAIRSREMNRLSQGVRERANLGGTLFSGGAQQQERLARQELGQAYSTEDISREATQRQNALLAAYPYLQLLFPNSGIQAPAFQSAVPSAESQLSAIMTGRGQDVGLASSIYGTQAGMYNQQSASNSALQSAMWGALGQSIGGIGGGYAGTL
uniref:Uncharacterized protein n=1 Tax=viral metagenome TaxID=1070528 RepID=A0A6M3L8Z3_9ZZZZ